MNRIYRNLGQNKEAWVEQTPKQKWRLAQYAVSAPTGRRTVLGQFLAPAFLSTATYSGEQLPAGWKAEFDTADDVFSFVEGEIVAGRDPSPFIYATDHI